MAPITVVAQIYKNRIQSSQNQTLYSRPFTYHGPVKIGQLVRDALGEAKLGKKILGTEIPARVMCPFEGNPQVMVDVGEEESARDGTVYSILLGGPGTRRRQSSIGGTSTALQNDDDYILQVLNFVDCKVCTGPASGMHYGEYSCEGCKAFFARYLKDRVKKDFEGYPCEGPKKSLPEGNCPLGPKEGRQCRHCRLQKCMQLGMSRERIKLGKKPGSKNRKNREAEKQNCNIMDEEEMRRIAEIALNLQHEHHQHHYSDSLPLLLGSNDHEQQPHPELQYPQKSNQCHPQLLYAEKVENRQKEQQQYQHLHIPNQIPTNGLEQLASTSSASANY